MEKDELKIKNKQIKDTGIYNDYQSVIDACKIYIWYIRTFHPESFPDKNASEDNDEKDSDDSDDTAVGKDNEVTRLGNRFIWDWCFTLCRACLAWLVGSRAL